MPQILRIGPYIVYFWSNENNPLEPVHVHIAEGKASANATKLWITSTGKVLLCNNNFLMESLCRSDPRRHPWREAPHPASDGKRIRTVWQREELPLSLPSIY